MWMTLLLLNFDFKIKDLGELRYFLGIEFVKPVDTPIEQNHSIDDKCGELPHDIRS